jgi:polysaccharide deacetylase family protein (PEP-CTERM system associated)
MEHILNILEDTGLKATFFCLGWIAKKYPDVIKAIVNRGYEVGTHTNMHQLVYEQKPETFFDDIERSIKTLEDISGKNIRCFRAPGFSIREDTCWAFDILAKLGISIDSSIFPARRMHGGFPSFKTAMPVIIQYKGIRIKEFPISSTSVFGKSFIYSGGGYFRFFPYWFIKGCTRKNSYVMTYFHPRDLDIGQPMLKDLSLTRKFRSYFGISETYKKLYKYLNDFEFIDIDGADKLIDWDNAPVISI